MIVRMEVLELKPIKKKRVCAYVAKKNKDDFNYFNIPKLSEFLEKKQINFITIDFNINLDEFNESPLAKSLKQLDIKYFQVDIPEYAMGYIYQEIVEKEELLNDLCEEFETMEVKNSFKGEKIGLIC